MNAFFSFNKSALMRTMEIVSLVFIVLFSVPAFSGAYGVPTAPFKLDDCLVYMKNSVTFSGPGRVEPGPNDPLTLRSDICAQNIVTIGGTGNIAAPRGANNLKDVAIISPDIFIDKKGRVSNTICDGLGCLTFVAGTTLPLAANRLTNLNPGTDLPVFPTTPTLPANPDLATTACGPAPGVPNSGPCADFVVSSTNNTITPGVYGCLIAPNNSKLTFTQPGDYVFKCVDAGSIDITFVDDPKGVSIFVQQFFSLSHTANYNVTGAYNIRLYVLGIDSTYIPPAAPCNTQACPYPNPNRPGVGGLPAAMQIDGDGDHIGCFDLVPNGTTNIAGHSHPFTEVQFLGKDFQQMSGPAVALRSHQESYNTCLAGTTALCNFTQSMSCSGTGKLTLTGSFQSFDQLAIIPVSASINLGDPAASVIALAPNGTLIDVAQISITTVTATNDTATTNANAPFGLTDDDYYVALLENTAAGTVNYNVFSGQILRINGGQCSVVQ